MAASGYDLALRDRNAMSVIMTTFSSRGDREEFSIARFALKEDADRLPYPTRASGL
jgi:hypothetical protein